MQNCKHKRFCVPWTQQQTDNLALLALIISILCCREMSHSTEKNAFEIKTSGKPQSVQQSTCIVQLIQQSISHLPACK